MTGDETMMDDDYLKLIEEARAKNNVNWMNILRLALESSPVEARAVLKAIRTIDLDISYYTQRLADEDIKPKRGAGSPAVHNRGNLSQP